nr:MAG TPA: hypothetical protein [Caudoviricetes sp.]
MAYGNVNNGNSNPETVLIMLYIKFFVKDLGCEFIAQLIVIF